MLSEVVLVDKPEGMTPLQALNKFKEKFPEYQDLRMTYAGRLDPMASGLLLFLSGSAILKKEEYLSLPKKYAAQILLDFETDSFDILGLITKSNTKREKVGSSDIEDALKVLGTQPELVLPPYSSPPVEGTPLHILAREGLIDIDSAPKRQMQFDVIEVGEIQSITNTDLLHSIESRVSKVDGDFRQEETVTRWKEVLSEAAEYQVVNMTIECQGGAYIRSLAYALGELLKTSAILYSLRRDKVGDFDLDQAIKLV